MTMQDNQQTSRRRFLAAAGAMAAAAALPGLASARTAFRPSPAHGWRVFEIATRVEVLKPAGATRVWLPLPSIEEAAWIRPMGNLWQGNAAAMRVTSEPDYGAAMLYAEWPAGQPAPTLEVVSRVATRDRAHDLAAPGTVEPLDPATRALYTRATELLPTDGIVRETALGVTWGAKRDLDKARLIYDWICDNTFRDPKVLGCGFGDISAMLETGNLSGKCADLNALFVGLARAVGLPARDVYGIRVADSRFGYKSLGKSGDISKAQHCRAEVWLERFGWVPVDPADVGKVALEEQPGLTLQDELVTQVRAKLFGGWEMNWLGYNFAHDVGLPGSRGPMIPYLMYPQGETSAGRLDSLDPERFRYRITSREVAAA
jgi:transglutaminase-like putative cysteine protease